MRKLSFMFLFVVSSFSFSQNYIPMPDSGAVWINEHLTYYLDQNNFPIYNSPGFVSYCTHGEDSTINMIDYFKVDTCGAGYKGAMRNDSGKVWWVPADSTQEYLLYDFTVNTGDTIYDVWIEDYWNSGPGLYDIVFNLTNTVDSILINGEYRIVINTEGAEWIEGIGCVGGLFWEYWPNVSNYFVSLNCHSVNDTTLYPNYSIEPCPWEIVGFEQNELIFNVYPNPVSDYLKVEFPSQNHGHINIFNYQGKLLHQQTVQSSTNTIDVSRLETGTYILIIETDKARGVQRFIKE